MKKIFVILFCICFAFVSCAKQGKSAKEETVKMVFYPNESGDAIAFAREAFRKILEEATGRKAEIITTTDYNIALETLVGGKANAAYVGAQGYVQAHKRNPKIVPLVTNSGASGTLEDALYYSFIAVASENEGLYGSKGNYDLTKLKGKTVSFVSVNSTSGFNIPAMLLCSALNVENTDKLIEKDGVFKKVIFASSHQASQATLFRGDSDVACFAIPRAFKIYNLVSEKADADGSVYEVAKTDTEPFSSFIGRKITILKAIPVLNAPIVVNEGTLTKEEIQKIQNALASDEVANNPGVFNVEGSKNKGLFPKYSDKTRLVPVTDEWYDKIRASL